jgi:hypothetical protein
MTSKLTQKELIALHLSDHIGQWFLEYELRGLATKRGFIGDEAKKRCRDSFKKGARLAQDEYNSLIIDLGRSHEGKFASIRATTFKAKPRQVMEHLPGGNVRVTYV